MTQIVQQFIIPGSTGGGLGGGWMKGRIANDKLQTEDKRQRPHRYSTHEDERKVREGENEDEELKALHNK